MNAIVRKQAARIDGLAVARAKVAKDIEKLRTSPADPGANLAVGRYLCIELGAWERGLPLLALGSDPKLSALAKRELAGQADGAKQRDLGDGWWEAALSQPGPAKTQVQSHAIYWYRKAILGDLKGLDRAVIEKRVAVYDASHADERHSLVIDLLNLVGNQAKVTEGSWSTDATGLKSAGDSNSILLPYSPPEEYDLRVTFTRIRGNDTIAIICPLEHGTVNWIASGWNGDTFGFAHLTSNRGWVTITKSSIPNGVVKGVRYTAVIRVRKAGVKALFNDQLISEFAGDGTGYRCDPSEINGVRVIGFSAKESVVISSVEIEEISGHGHSVKERD
jgi:hypothetical protein